MMKLSDFSKLIIFMLIAAMCLLAIFLFNNSYFNWYLNTQILIFLLSPVSIISLFILIISYIFIIYRLSNQFYAAYFNIILGLAILLMLGLIFLPPVTSTDIYQYIFQAKIFNTFHENPFSAKPISFPLGQFDHLLSNVHIASNYGPVWMLMAIFYNIIGQDNIVINLILLKLNNLLFIFLCAYLIMKIAEKVNDKLKYKSFFLFILNPIILFEFLLDGHNDLIMIFFLILSVYLLINKKYFYVLPVLTISFLVKYLTIILFPIFVIYLLFRIKDKELKLGHFLLSLILSLAIFLLSYLPFSPYLANFTGLFETVSLTNHFLIYFARSLLFNLNYSKIFLNLIFIILYFQLIKDKEIYINNKLFFKKIFILLFLYFFIACFWLQPWYLPILLPFALFLDDSKYSIILVSGFYLFLDFYQFLLYSFFP